MTGVGSSQISGAVQIVYAGAVETGDKGWGRV